MSAAEAYGALNRTERIVSQPKVAQEYLPGVSTSQVDSRPKTDQ
jgi:hypothetical protein